MLLNTTTVTPPKILMQNPVEIPFYNGIISLGIDQDATDGTEEITKPLIVMDLQ